MQHEGKQEATGARCSIMPHCMLLCNEEGAMLTNAHGKHPQTSTNSVGNKLTSAHGHHAA
jgi:hypothetical protein